jgi:hypothetical protein
MILKIKNNKVLNTLTPKEHDLKDHAPIGFCSYCKRKIYIPYSVHEAYECLQNPRYVGLCLEFIDEDFKQCKVL